MMGVQEESYILSSWTPSRDSRLKQMPLNITWQICPACNDGSSETAKNLLLHFRFNLIRCFWR